MSQSFLRSLFALILMLGHLNLPEPSLWIPDSYPGVAIFVLPFVLDLDISEATLQPDEPQHCSPTDRTVWYGFIPSGPITVTVDRRGSTNTNISIFRETGDSATFAGLEFMECTSGEPVTLSLEPGERYLIQVGAIVGEAGTVHASLSDVIALSGRVVDAVTGAALPGYEWPFAWVTLHRVCGENCLEEVGSIPADREGWFRFEDYRMWGIEPGTYLFRVSAMSYAEGQFGPFAFSEGSLDVGDLALNPLPKLHSIRGRVIDKATGKPIPPIFSPVVTLYRCTEEDCLEFVNSQTPDRNGQFRLETDLDGFPLPAGTYQLVAVADQYEQLETQLVEATEGKDQN